MPAWAGAPTGGRYVSPQLSARGAGNRDPSVSGVPLPIRLLVSGVHYTAPGASPRASSPASSPSGRSRPARAVFTGRAHRPGSSPAGSEVETADRRVRPRQAWQVQSQDNLDIFY